MSLAAATRMDLEIIILSGPLAPKASALACGVSSVQSGSVFLASVFSPLHGIFPEALTQQTSQAGNRE